MSPEQKNQRIERLNMSLGVCEVCGKPLAEGQMQLGHCIGQTIPNIKRYGTFFINSVYNAKYVCSLGCNSTADVGKSKGNVLKQLAFILINEIIKEMGKPGIDFMTDILLEKYKKMGYN